MSLLSRGHDQVSVGRTRRSRRVRRLTATTVVIAMTVGVSPVAATVASASTSVQKTRQPVTASKPMAEPTRRVIHIPPPQPPGRPSSSAAAKAAAAKATAPQGTNAPSEGWSTFSHWVRDLDGKVTEQLYAQPEFHPTSAGWKQIDPSVHASDHGKPAGAEGTIRPVRFGGNPNDLFELDLDKGPVTLSDPSLAVKGTHVRNNGVDYSTAAPETPACRTR